MTNIHCATVQKLTSLLNPRCGGSTVHAGQRYQAGRGTNESRGTRPRPCHHKTVSPPPVFSFLPKLNDPNEAETPPPTSVVRRPPSSKILQRRRRSTMAVHFVQRSKAGVLASVFHLLCFDVFESQKKLICPSLREIRLEVTLQKQKCCADRFFGSHTH